MSSRKRRNVKVGRTVPMVSLRKNTCGLCRAKTRRPYVHTKKSHGTAPDFVNVYNEEEEEALDEADELFEDLEEPDATPSSSAKRAPSRLSREQRSGAGPHKTSAKKFTAGGQGGNRYCERVREDAGPHVQGAQQEEAGAVGGEDEALCG